MRRRLTPWCRHFTDDPVERWLYPETQKYLTHFPEFLAAFGGNAIDQHTAWTLGELTAVALWWPPDTEPEVDAITTVLTDSVSSGRHGDLSSPSTNGTGSRSQAARNQEHARRSRSY
jgi:hypothetical protein